MWYAEHPQRCRLPPIRREFADQFQATRAAWLRRRFLVLCALVTAAAAAGLVAALTFPPPQSAMPIVSIFGSLAVPAAIGQVLLFSSLFVAAYRRPGIPQATTLRLVAIGVSIFPFLQLPISPRYVGPLESLAVALGFTINFGFAIPVLLSTLLIHLTASLLMPWTPREAIRPILPFLALYLSMSALEFLGGGSDIFMLGFLALSIAGMIGPGLAVAAIRHARFADRFQNRAISVRYDELSTELNLARRIHERLFPAPITDGPIRLAFAYEPMRQIGGDFLFARSGPPHHPWLSLAFIDVTGHGIAAALAVNRLHGELERIFGTHPDPAPGLVLAELNRYFHLSMAAESIYATALCLRIDPAADSLRWASAAHPPAILSVPVADAAPMNPDRKGGARSPLPRAIAQLPATTFILGAAPHSDFDPEEQQAAFPPGASLLAYTDGAFELRIRPAGMLGLRGLLDLAASHRAATSWTSAVLADLKSLREGPPTDDILIVQVSRP